MVTRSNSSPFQANLLQEKIKISPRKVVPIVVKPKMNSYSITSLILLLGLISNCTCQTFQYSRGWTNGKRNVPLANSPSGRLGSNFKHSEPLGLADAMLLSSLANGIENSEERLGTHPYPQYLRVAIPAAVRRKVSRLDYPVEFPMNVGDANSPTRSSRWPSWTFARDESPKLGTSVASTSNSNAIDETSQQIRK